MDNPATYINFGVISISVPNLLIIGLMVVVFAAALLIPMPHGADSGDGREDG